MEKRSQLYQKAVIDCWKKFIIFIIAIRTFIVRCIFILYASIAIWNVVLVKTSIYWLLLTTLVPLFIETFIGIQQIKLDVKPKSKVSKWFSPVVFLFLVCACPPIWIMELTIASNVTNIPVILNKTSQIVTISPLQPQLFPTTIKSINLTQTSIAPIYPATNIDSNFTFINLENNSLSNNTNYNETTNDNNSTLNDSVSPMPKPTSEILTVVNEITTTNSLFNISANPKIYIITRNISDVYIYGVSDITKAIEQKGSDVLKKIESIWAYLDVPYRTTILEQVLLLTLIICRWLLPRGGITRDQLSQLLLVNIGMAADILELFEALKEKVVRHHLILNITILVLWQLSLFQFSLTKTVTKARKVRLGYFEEYSTKSNTENNLRLTNCICCRTELWAIATSLLLQDIPFFCLRITLIVDFDVLSYSNIFFTCKNSLVILLQLFRSYVILSGKTDENQLESTISRQSLVAGSVARWNQVQGNSSAIEPSIDTRKALFTEQYELTKTSRENILHSGILPKASPELSISSKENIPQSNSLYSINSSKNKNF